MAVIILPGFLLLMLQTGFVQTYLAKKVASVLSDKLHTEVSIGSLQITFLLDVILEDVLVKDQHKGVLLSADALLVDMNDVFFERNLISLNNIILHKSTVNLIKYKGEKKLNYQFLLDYFNSTDTTKSKGSRSWKIWIASLNLINSNFTYQNQNKQLADKGIDFNDLGLTDINAKIDNLLMIKDTIYANINSLSFKDKSGFVVKNFSTSAKVSPVGIIADDLRLETTETSLAIDLAFNYNSYDDFDNFIDKVKISALFKPSRIYLNDIGYFSPEFFGMNNKINVAGEIKGNIANLKGKDFQFLYGKSTYFLGNFNISGLPNIESTYIHFNIRNFFTCQYDLQNFELPTSSGIQHLSLPDEVVRLGNVRFKGAFTGFYNDFVAYGDFITDMGKITTDITLRKNHTTNQIEYDGKVASTNLNIGNILALPDEFGYISMNATVSGSGLDADNAALNMKGTIASIDFRNYHYNNIQVEGNLAKKKFNGYMKIDDENVKLDFNGTVDYSKDLPSFNVKSKIENLRMSKLHFMDLSSDSLSSLSTELELDFAGNTIDNIQGTIHAENTSFVYKGAKHFMSNFLFSNTAEKNGDKSLKLRSDYIDADISGNFMFNDLYLSSLKFIKDYMPSYSSWIKENLDSIPEQNFVYFIKLKNTSSLCELFMPDLTVSPNTVLKGSYNTKQSLLDLNITSALTTYQNMKFKDFFISGKTKDSRINVNIGCEQIAFSDSIGLDNVVFKSVTRNDSINYKLIWENANDNIKNSGNIIGFLSFYQRPRFELKFLDAKLVINDTAWTIDPGNDISFDSSSINIKDLLFSTESQHLKINGSVSQNPADLLHINFENFNVSDLDMLNSYTGVDFDGYLNGNVDVSNIYKSPNVVSDLTINDFYVNKDRLGKAILITTWDDLKKAFTINADIIYEGSTGSNKPISIAGSYYPERKKDNFDLELELTNFKLKLLEKYLSSFSSNFKGYATGRLKLKGTPAEPDLQGHLFLMVKGFKIDYLNENYSFTDSVIVTNNAFSFDHIVINDSYGDTAILDGSITHKNFKNMKFDLAIRPYNLQCLNTDASMNSMFYGKAYVSGLVKISGDVNNIKMDIDAKTEKNTHLFIPISSESEISDNDFIRFTSKKVQISKTDDYNVDLSGITLNMDLDVTPVADVQIIFDSKIGDIIKAKGSGNLRMEITTKGDFNMYGDYVIDQGDYLFTLKNVINKKFTIQKGSSLKWNGSPYDAYADITAVYAVKAALSDLNGDTSSTYKKRIDVDCLLGMKDKIFNPTISFDLDLPNSDEATKTLVKSIVNNEQEMNQQIFSLLILNRFTMPGKIPNVNSGLGSTSTELLSNQLSNWLSQISRKVDVGVNYRPGNQMTSDELEIMLATQIFNDRMSIDVNGGVSGTQGNNGKTSNIVGDVNIEYKINKDGRLLVKGYNKSNTVDMLNNNSPYTQGLGIFYRREFDTFGELLKRRKKIIK